MVSLFGLCDILKYGYISNGVLEVQESFQLKLNKPDNNDDCMIVSLNACYIGDKAPTIKFCLLVSNSSQDNEMLYESHEYNIGSKEEFSIKEWRIPPMISADIHAVIHVRIPDNTKLFVRDMHNTYSPAQVQWRCGIRHNAHLGFYGMAPNCTMPAFELAAKCGFPACIVVPKVTADGKLMCIHDDTINATARKKDGSEFDEDVYVSDTTYRELQEFDFGSCKNNFYKGTKMPLLEDFFALCAKTGMRPMFSTHPALSVEEWKKVKLMLKKYGLLKVFHIKSFSLEILETAYSIFGDSIEGYTWDDGDVKKMKETAINPYKCRVGIELKFDSYTKEIVEEIIDAGFFAAAWKIGHRNMDEYRRVMSYGVTEFTEDYHCSMGLNW